MSASYTKLPEAVPPPVNATPDRVQVTGVADATPVKAASNNSAITILTILRLSETKKVCIIPEAELANQAPFQ